MLNRFYYLLLFSINDLVLLCVPYRADHLLWLIFEYFVDELTFQVAFILKQENIQLTKVSFIYFDEIKTVVGANCYFILSLGLH